jgi:hypothetical protein
MSRMTRIRTDGFLNRSKRRQPRLHLVRASQRRLCIPCFLPLERLFRRAAEPKSPRRLLPIQFPAAGPAVVPYLSVLSVQSVVFVGRDQQAGRMCYFGAKGGDPPSPSEPTREATARHGLRRGCQSNPLIWSKRINDFFEAWIAA